MERPTARRSGLNISNPCYVSTTCCKPLTNKVNSEQLSGAGYQYITKKASKDGYKYKKTFYETYVAQGD
jgi:hypothetical protein